MQEQRAYPAFMHGSEFVLSGDLPDSLRRERTVHVLFYNTRGRCHLYRSCNRRRRPTTSGVTMMKLLPSTTESTTTTETSTTLELSTTQAGDWATGVKLTHFWDCNGMACDAGTLQPWDQSKYVASPGYSPQNPDNHGGAVYGERMWLVGAASD